MSGRSERAAGICCGSHVKVNVVGSISTKLRPHSKLKGIFGRPRGVSAPELCRYLDNAGRWLAVIYYGAGAARRRGGADDRLSRCWGPATINRATRPD